ncbi:Type II and III secretion system protein [Pseudomonas savastanoi]|nr:Type II and III secretion system family protein [Pseudomonas syringae pv. castaneae]KPX36659.1 Type II and III secretion system family protein [Pseudomonas amygdali pv. eriobotryae]RMO19073.1 Type II and III secretion system protein [Pseudomonas amygdali pv. morsprunorum]RMS83353.1 Type II and III secretion system protein [Pseudomonas savastanoi]RMM02862.1 Type II and III secretion system protein [Pseudomonas amygdali pv. eriobotryae]
MIMPVRNLLNVVITSVLIAFSTQALSATEVVPLNYRTSADLLPVAKSFLGTEGSVSAYGNQLIVNAESRKIEELRTLIAQLDTAPKRLLISVDTSDNATRNSSGSRVIEYGTASREGSVQQVQTSEGTPALIQIGQSVPLTSSSTDSYGYSQSNTEYRNVTQGFYVTASVTGDTVHLSISTNHDRMSQERADAIKVQSTDSQVSGRLGEWITLASNSDQSVADQRGLAQRYSTQGRDDMILRVKVETLE